MKELRTSRGRPTPLGPFHTSDGINFALLSRHATSVSLVILPESGPPHPIAETPLDHRINRTGDHWHIFVSGQDLPATFCYGWRVDGPKGKRHRFDPTVILNDPCATILSAGEKWAATCQTDPHRTGRHSVVAPSNPYDWEKDAPPLTPHEDTIVYELHVRGFTQHGSSMVVSPGTYHGLIEKIDYLKWLGITAVELLPIHEFDECDCPFTNPDTGEPLVNFWGYNSTAFAAPKAAFAATSSKNGQIHEFRDLVKAFHAADIEVYLDVVFNHTGEGDDRGRTYSLRGIDNELYYLMDDDGHYLNFTGTGNTVNCNHPLVRDLILSCLRYWVVGMHIDGFRFDLASILGRDRNGHVMIEPPVIEMIAEDGVLTDTKLIAEPWDAAGLFQVGHFPFGRRWSEWNGLYRDDVRRAWTGEPGMMSALATRIAGSSDLYQWNGRLPRHSVNFITCHDGFTLWDLVSYNEKHNHANGEENRDGSGTNWSWNGGVEGPTDDPEIHELRVRRAKGMMATLLLSQGIPMILGGDEFLRTQQGNNNAWCQDNELSWVDWTLADTNSGFLRFVREMIWLRRRHAIFRRRQFFSGELRSGMKGRAPMPPRFPEAGPVRPGEAGLPADVTGRAPLHTDEGTTTPRPSVLADIIWHGTEPNKPDFSGGSQCLAFSLDGRFTGREGEPDSHLDRDFYVALNTAHGSRTFTIPPSPTGRPWRLVVDTTQPSPHDFLDEETGPTVQPLARIELAAFGMIVLMSDE